MTAASTRFGRHVRHDSSTGARVSASRASAAPQSFLCASRMSARVASARPGRASPVPCSVTTSNRSGRAVAMRIVPSSAWHGTASAPRARSRGMIWARRGSGHVSKRDDRRVVDGGQVPSRWFRQRGPRRQDMRRAAGRVPAPSPRWPAPRPRRYGSVVDQHPCEDRIGGAGLGRMGQRLRGCQPQMRRPVGTCDPNPRHRARLGALARRFDYRDLRPSAATTQSCRRTSCSDRG
jgi:hypothetical protein